MSPSQIIDPTGQAHDQTIEGTTLIGDASKSPKTGFVQITSAEVTAVSDPESPSENSGSSLGIPDLEGSEKLAASSLAIPDEQNNEPEPIEATTTKILRVIETYSLNFERSDESWGGLTTFVPTVTKQVAQGQPIKLLLPGFPFKSPNSKDKVLGVLPDLGEELALAHLDSLCKNVTAVYEHGAEVHICSDGLVYNDLLGVPDETVWEYGEALRQIAVKNDLHNLKFIRLWDLLDHPGLWNKDYYVTHASCIRRELAYRYQDLDFEADMATKSDEDVHMTHRSYIELLGKDLALREDFQSLSPEAKASAICSIAKSMMGRWKAFAAALEANRKEYIRLSIHDSTGKGKLSMSLLPQGRGALGFTPWHSSVSVELDGSYRTVHASDVRDSHTLVYKNGRPHCFRAKSDLFNWPLDGLGIEIEHLYPCGMIIRPVGVHDSSSAPSIRAIPMRKVRQLSHTFSPIVLRGFSESMDEELYVRKGHELGKILEWTFGIIMKVKDSGETNKEANNVTSNEALPMHFDGIFKFIDKIDPKTGKMVKQLAPPGYQYFTCISTAPKGDGYTLFCNSRLFFRYLAPPWSLERLEPVTWHMVNDGFWSAKQTGLPLVIRHPYTNAPCIRWHEPWTKTKFSKYIVTIENEDQELVEVARNLVYDYRTCLRFTWEKGDLLVNDNVTMLHTRTAYASECDREIWRIHFD
ncbi:Clavaminate synthase-like protein [Lindgomyces ingoldianus]|uniref:Clavaminate synthase-like protein n=1 Tax=Lindgomyces ingoldianus TaxID=673940 RepID=A0ACB6R985_9PLEO|nr:Clavaminate synthase-like protein [Lindgomyces ingoldianus]KAF2475878.1 Clavaminate synthase-like protein [Lindgomyces ingoldianus]